MKKIFDSYIQSISQKFTHKETSEMGYRTDFEILIQAIFESINVRRIDHDPKASKGNKPDFIVMKYDIPILYIEVKAIGVSLDKIEKSEQMARYFGYANLVLTDYVEFRFYRNGERYEEPIIIAEYDKKNRTISPHPENFEHLSKSLIDFAQSHKEPIKNGLHLAKIMGGKAQRIRDNLLQFLSVDSQKNSEINKIYNTLKKLLVHDLKPDAFADMYAQTLVYGLFVARYHDQTPEVVKGFKIGITKWCKLNNHNNFKWQCLFYDRIIRNKNELFNNRKYIQQNPLKWEIEKGIDNLDI